jgi:hypothetical protein
MRYYDIARRARHAAGLDPTAQMLAVLELLHGGLLSFYTINDDLVASGKLPTPCGHVEDGRIFFARCEAVVRRAGTAARARMLTIDGEPVLEASVAAHPSKADIILSSADLKEGNTITMRGAIITHEAKKEGP